tara:strand:- start:98 stop:379 length:282 start_codon:yes stop_codon:yes gene_type:complete
MANGGCRFTLREYSAGEHCNHIMGVDLEIWFMLCSFLIIAALVFFRIVYGAIRGEKLGDMIDGLVEPMEGDGDSLKIEGVRGIISTFSKDDDD